MNKKQIKILDTLLFTVLLIIYTIITFTLFYNQAYGNPSSYHSDVKAYILEMQGLDSGYSFPYPIFFKLGALFNLFFVPQVAITIALTLLNSSGVVVLKYYLNKQFCQEIEEKELKIQILIRVGISFLTLSLFLVSMIFSITKITLPGLSYRYAGVWTPNPYHNATYMATRPFAIACFFQFSDILQQYEKQFSWKKGLLFSISLLLTTMTKPSFTIVLVGAAGLIMVYRMFKSKFNNFKPTILLGLCFVPTFCHLLYQFFGVFGPTESGETGIGFGWLTAWRNYCNNVPLAVCLGLAFPIIVLIFHWKELKKNGLYRFSIQIVAMSLVMLMILYEKGFRLPDMNFSWGYMHGMFFAFVGAVIVLLRSTLIQNQKWYILSIQWCAFLWHLGCGLIYFRSILLGYMYY